MPFPLRVLIRDLFIFTKNFQVAVFNDKNVVEENRRQYIYGNGKDSRLRLR